MEDTKSNWAPVLENMKNTKKVRLGRCASDWHRKNPKKLLNYLTYYKFAAKMIGKSKKILDIGCNEGLGTWILAKECGYACGIDSNEEAIQAANSNFQSPKTSFHFEDLSNFSNHQTWDAITSFSAVECTSQKNTNEYFSQISKRLNPYGMAIIGVENKISQDTLSKTFEADLRNNFSNVFVFSAVDEFIHPGFSQNANHFIAICISTD